MASDIMEVAALGRPFTLGMLYDARRDRLIPGVKLWDDSSQEERTEEQDQPSTYLNVIKSDSFESKSSLLDVDSSMKLSVLSGMVKVGGSARYLLNKKKFQHQSLFTLHYKATTKFKQLTLNPQKIKNIKLTDNVRSSATHVVTGILYGTNAFVVFDSKKLGASNIQDTQASMETVINNIPSFNVDGKVDIKLSDEDKAVTDQFTCQFYGDFILESNPVTFEDAVKTVSQLPKLLGENKDNGVPLKVTLMPLKDLHLKAKVRIEEINPGLVRKAEDILQDLHNVEIRCNDLLEDKVVRSFPQIQEKLIRFKKLCEYYRSSLQQTMAEKFLSTRVGKEDTQKLVKVFDDRDKSPFSQERLTKWIEYQEKEINNISCILNILQGIKIISDQSKLDREVFNSEKEVLCFAFTSLKYTPYLQNMSDYLDKMKLDSGNTTPAKDHWYFSDDVRAKMIKKAKLLKDSSRFYCLVAAIGKDKYKGASIYHYRNTGLVTADFSGPDINDVETVRDRSDLMWYACDLTLDPNTAHCELVLSEGKKKVKRGKTQLYPDLPERFSKLPQVLCREKLNGRHYWEVQLSASWLAVVSVGVCYSQLERKGNSDLCKLGYNEKSWSCSCRYLLGLWYFVVHNGLKIFKLPKGCPKLGVFLDWHAGTLSYYVVSCDKLTHMYTFRTKFSEPVHPGFRLWTLFTISDEDSVLLM
ncbi:neoverrucotoxin subunit beta-like [Neolamprologus brichardi]|uniref:neoverrucotoxin subunit beta-like n=1 Tax=Neolamprologus brichardi TaxID=32507 RepID=UPI0003EC634F|nr:neoverrucotoxin subunit beta-like [Neolamprologus brichardi]